MLRHSFEFARCLSFGSKSRPFLCAGPFVSDRTIARYQQAWDVNAKLYLRHPSHIQVSTHHDSVMSVISGTFPSPEWDHLKHNISKNQRNFDEAFIKVISTSFILCSTAPSVSRAAPPKPPSEKRLEGKSVAQVSLIMSKYNEELKRYNDFTPIWEERCNQAALCIHSMCEELGKRLTFQRRALGILDHKEPQFEQKDYKHYVRVMTDHKDKCGSVGGVVMSWQSLLHGKKARMFLPHYLLMKEFVHTIPSFSSHASQVLAFVTNDQDVVFNDCPAEIALVRQIIQSAADSEVLPSDVASKCYPRKVDGS